MNYFLGAVPENSEFLDPLRLVLGPLSGLLLSVL